MPETSNNETGFHEEGEKILIDLWEEGYVASGNSSHAKYCGQYLAYDLIDAARQHCNKVGARLGFKQDGRPSNWGCGFFDNEADARKSNG